jgi:pyrimidine precursor biosynthesis enzyme
MAPTDYTAVRVGMNVSKAIIEGTIDAGIGLENVQMVELEEWLVAQGREKMEVKMLRIDELAELGCCCFCSVLYIGMLGPSSSLVANFGRLCLLTVVIGNDSFIANNPEKVKAFLRAVKRATDEVVADPEASLAVYISAKPAMGTSVNRKIFERSFAYFSRDLQNVKRDWVRRYSPLNFMCR